MFKNKYLKYKQKYLDLKNQIGGVDSSICRNMLNIIFMRRYLEAYIREQISKNSRSEFYNGKASIEFFISNSI